MKKIGSIIVYLLIAGFVLVWLFAWVKNARGAEQIDIQKVYDWAKTKPEGAVEKIIGIKKGTTIGLITIKKEVNLSGHSFKWTYDRHYLELEFVRYKSGKTAFKPILRLEVRHFQELVSGGRQDVQWSFADHKLNWLREETGDRYSRKFHVWAPWEIYIVYPDNFRNLDWYKPSERKANKTYQKEIAFWLSQM